MLCMISVVCDFLIIANDPSHGQFGQIFCILREYEFYCVSVVFYMSQLSDFS